MNAATRVGVDVGGTFTDVVLHRDDGSVAVRKLLSTPPSYDRAVIEAVSALAGDGEVSEVVHGTTVATNAVLERRGSRTALVTTAGFRDVLELRRLRIPHMYDLFWRKPPPLVERRLRFEVNERVTADGTVLGRSTRPSAALSPRACAPPASSPSPSAFSTPTSTPSTSSASASSSRRSYPRASISLSSEILREQREYERSATTVVNAYVRPLMGSYLDRIRTGLDGIGLAGAAQIMQSSGGVMTADDAQRAARVRARVRPGGGRRRRPRDGRAARVPNVIAFDMGGTTAKASLIEDGAISRGPRVRGRRLDLGRQPADPRRRRAAADPDDRHRGGRRGRRQPRVARPRRRPPGRAAQRRRRPGAGLLRARRHRADRDRRERRPRLHAGGHGRGRPDLDLRRGAPRRQSRCVAGPLGLSAARGRERHPPDRERADDACAPIGLVREGPRPARLRARRLRWLGPDPRGRAGRRPRRQHRPRPRGRGPLQRRRPAVRPARVPRRAHVPSRRSIAAIPTRSPRSSRRWRPASRRPSRVARWSGCGAPTCATAARAGRSRRRWIPAAVDRAALASLRARFEDEHERLYGVRDQPARPSRSARCGSPRSAASSAAADVRRGRRRSDGGRRRARCRPTAIGLDAPVRSRASVGAEPEQGPLLVDEYDTTVVVPPVWTIRREPRDRDARARARRRWLTRSRSRSSPTGSPRSPTRWRRRSSAPPTRRVVRDGMDFSASVCDAQGRDGRAGRDGSLPPRLVPAAMETLLAHYGGRMQPGDVFLMNDPFDGGIHLQDSSSSSPSTSRARLIGVHVHDRAPRRRRRPAARLERVRQHGDLPGGHPAALAPALRRRRAGRGRLQDPGGERADPADDVRRPRRPGGRVRSGRTCASSPSQSVTAAASSTRCSRR